MKKTDVHIFVWRARAHFRMAGPPYENVHVGGPPYQNVHVGFFIHTSRKRKKSTINS